MTFDLLEAKPGMAFKRLADGKIYNYVGEHLYDSNWAVFQAPADDLTVYDGLAKNFFARAPEHDIQVP